jgi:acetylornithine deacetylase/succinyl-diaminopimelate desuccinylase-like protein
MSTVHVSPLTQTQFEQAISDLGKFVAIPSVSHPESPDYKKENLIQAAEFASSKLTHLGFKVSHVSIDGSAPFVIAERIHDVALPTLLLYAHYDVQPVDRDKWSSDPFKLEERKGRLYGRGSSDDKAGIIAITTAIEACLEAKIKIPNIRILFEGEEEYGSSHMSALLKQEAERLHAHALVVLDGLNRDPETGTLTSSTRGIVNIDVEVKALEKPVHSGVGCIVPDPIQDLVRLTHSVLEPKNIPGFMDGCEQLSETERSLLRESSISAETYAKDMGMKLNAQLRGNPNESVYERIRTEPSLSILNFNSGKPNGGNSIQDQASCTLSIRVLPGQDPDKVAEAVIQHLSSQKLASGFEVKITQVEKGARAWTADLSTPFSKIYFEALKENFPKVASMPTGGALPLLHDFKEIFPDLEMIVAAVEDNQTNAHSHDESQDIAVFKNAIQSLIVFLERVGKQKS